MTAPLPRTERIQFGGKVAWIKRPEPARNSLFVPLHRILRYMLPAALHPTNSVGGPGALMAEGDRLEVFAKAGLPVPKLLERSPDHLILSDCGEHMGLHLYQLPDATPRRATIIRALAVLMQVHQAGLSHGRPHLKDFAIKAAGEISVLDLEEDPTKTMSLAEAQARDFWLFLGSTCRYFSDPEAGMAELYRIFRAQATDQTQMALDDLAIALRPYRRLVGLLHAQKLGPDVVGPYWATKTIEHRI